MFVVKDECVFRPPALVMPFDHMAAVQPPNCRIKGPPWWAPFGRYMLVDLSTGRVIARSADDEDLDAAPSAWPIWIV
jgi:hypothetical protein